MGSERIAAYNLVRKCVLYYTDVDLNKYLAMMQTHKLKKIIKALQAVNDLQSTTIIKMFQKIQQLEEGENKCQVSNQENTQPESKTTDS